MKNFLFLFIDEFKKKCFFMKEYFEKKRRRNRTKEKFSGGKPAKSCIANSSFKKSRKQIKRF